MSEATAHRTLVRDLMTVGVPTCPLAMSSQALARLILEKDYEGVVVLDEEGHGIGVVTRDDLVRNYDRENFDTLTAEDIMTEGVPQVPPDVPLAAAAHMMRDNGWRIVFLMHNANGIIYPAAMLSYKHFIRHLAAESNEELTDLGIKAARKPPLEVFIEKRDAARRKATGQ
jgi:CBS domain-containing protein